MKGWVRAWLMVIRLAGSSMRHFSRKSLSCCTLRRWASSSFCPPIRDCSRSRDGVMVDIVVIFSYRMIESWSTRHWYTSSCNTTDHKSGINVLRLLTFSVTLSTSVKRKLKFSSKCLEWNMPLRATRCGILPFSCIISFNISLLVLPGNSILPV